MINVWEKCLFKHIKSLIAGPDFADAIIFDNFTVNVGTNSTKYEQVIFNKDDETGKLIAKHTQNAAFKIIFPVSKIKRKLKNNVDIGFCLMTEDNNANHFIYSVDNIKTIPQYFIDEMNKDPKINAKLNKMNITIHITSH